MQKVREGHAWLEYGIIVGLCLHESAPLEFTVIVGTVPYDVL